MTSGRLLLVLASASLWPCAFTQTIVSAQSGVVNYFEGLVSIDGHALEQKAGRFYDVKAGSELRTERGRAEVLLTPGVMLRLDKDSSIRMVSTRLADTRIDFVSGAAALDSRNAAPGAPIVIAYHDYQMKFEKSGRYRVDSEPAQLKVEEGEAEVAFHNKSIVVKATEAVALSPKLAAHVEDHPIQDELDRWDQERSATLSAENTAAADSDNLSATLNNPQNATIGGAGGAGGGGYDPGYYGGLTPDIYAGGSSYATPGMTPFWLYSSPLYQYGFYPLYMGRPIYRPQPVRSGIYRAPVRTYAPTRQTYAPPPRLAPSRPIVRPLMHR